MDGGARRAEWLESEQRDERTANEAPTEAANRELNGRRRMDGRQRMDTDDWTANGAANEAANEAANGAAE